MAGAIAEGSGSEKHFLMACRIPSRIQVDEGEVGEYRPHMRACKRVPSQKNMPKINILGYRIGVPHRPLPRMLLGAAMVLGGLVGFLPVLGFWMVPVGLAILAIDFPPVRRFQRRMTVRFGNWLHRRWPGLAQRLGYGSPKPERRI